MFIILQSNAGTFKAKIIRKLTSAYALSGLCDSYGIFFPANVSNQFEKWFLGCRTQAMIKSSCNPTIWSVRIKATKER